jgi:hypothetical protein
MTENYYGYPLEEERDKEDIGEMKKPDERREQPLKHIKGPVPKPRPQPEVYKKKF